MNGHDAFGMQGEVSKMSAKTALGLGALGAAVAAPSSGFANYIVERHGRGGVRSTARRKARNEGALIGGVAGGIGGLAVGGPFGALGGAAGGAAGGAYGGVKGFEGRKRARRRR